MLSKSLIFCWTFAFLAFVTSISAQLSITNPVNGTIWRSGQQESITWTGNTSASSVTCVLRRGDPNALTTVATIGTNINPTLMHINYTVPDNTPSGSDYTVGIGTDPDFNYSHVFTIIGTDSNSITASSAPTSSASASASDSISTVTATSTSTDTPTTTSQSTSNAASTSPPTKIPSAPASISSHTEIPSLMSFSISAISLFFTFIALTR